MNTSIYFMGPSACGKTTMANYVAENYGIHHLDSAAREVFTKEFVHEFKDYARLIADKDAYFEFQQKVCALQIVKERAAREVHGSFVSDRCFDHVVYAALYGTRCNKIANSAAMTRYVQEIVTRDHNPIIFFCRPSYLIRQAAMRDGQRGNFLDWDAMQRFDGACQFILEAVGIPYTSVDVSGWDWRTALVDARLKEAGIYKKVSG